MFKWYTCNDDKFKLDKSPVLNSTDDSTVIFGDCSILSPVLKAKTYNGNYVYIEQFNRYYFITNVIWSHGYYYIKCDVDVTYSNRNGINNLDVLVARSESFRNTEIIDNMIPVNSQRQTIGGSYGKEVISNTETTHILGVIWQWLFHSFIKIIQKPNS